MTVHGRLPAEDHAQRLPYISSHLCHGTEQQEQFQSVKRNILQPGFHKIVLQGSAGMGKTFLVESIFRDQNVADKYEICLSASIPPGAPNLKAVYSALWRQLKPQANIPASTESRLNVLLRKELSSHKVLLAIDDVQTIAQAENLCTTLGAESSIMITTSAKCEFQDWMTYTLGPLSMEGSGRLLLAYAFPGIAHDALFAYVKRIGISTVDKVVKSCNGVPLVLKIAGAVLTKASLWVTAAALLDTIPAHRAHPMLLVCYQLLGHEEVQQCFLDMIVAPKHHEWSRGGLLQFWQYSRQISAADAKACEQFLLQAQMLEERRNSRGYARYALPGLLRTFAEDLVFRSGHVNERLRLCLPGLNEDEAFPSAWHVCTKSSFWHHTEVTYQATLISLMESDISSWVPPAHYHFPHTRAMLFSNCFSLQKLKLRGAESSLCSLDLKNCTSLEALPSKLSQCRELQYLNLKNCRQLVELPAVNKLVKLRAVNLEGCSSLKALPKGWEQLTALLVLNLRSCNSLSKLPSGLGYCSLISLPLDYCSSLTALPDTFRLMTSLQSITAPSCTSLVEFPDSVSSLVNVRELDFRLCTGLKTLGTGLAGMAALEKVNLAGCVSLKALPEGLGQLSGLRQLDISNCSSLNNIPESLSNLTQLSVLSLSGCSNLSLLPNGIGQLVGLTELDVSESRIWKLPDSMGGLSRLKRLQCSNCRNLKTLPQSITGLTQLEVLDLSVCASFCSLPDDIHHLTSLQRLSLSRCINFNRLPACVAELQNLRHLSLSYTGIAELPHDTSRLTALTALSLSHCAGLLHLPPTFGNLPSLSALDLRACKQLRSLPATFCGLSSLKTALMDDLPELIELPMDLGSLFSLTELSLTDCTKLQKLPPGICHLTGLESLSLSNCPNIIDLPAGFTKLKNLKELDLAGCSNLVALPKNMNRMTALKAVYLWACPALSSSLSESGLPPEVVRDADCLSDSMQFSAESLRGFNSRSDQRNDVNGMGLALRSDASGSSGFFSMTLQDVVEEDEEDLRDA